MRVISLQTKYEPRIWLDDEAKLILKIDCSCWNFVNRRIKKVGRVHNTKFFAEPCKHLKPWTDVLIRQGYKLKIPTLEGSDKCTAEIRRGVIKVWGPTCFFPGCKCINNLQIHRTVAGAYGGKYSILNCRPFCTEHHRVIHQKEF